MFPAAPLGLKARADAEGNGDGGAAIGAAGPPPVCEVGRILSSQNCFDLLKIGVSKSPEEKDVLAAYKTLSRIIHPDNHERATAAFQALQGAKEVLLDAAKLAKHLKDIEEAAAAAPPPPSSASAPDTTRGHNPQKRAYRNAEWMYNTFDFMDEMRKKEEEERKARWRRMHEERDREEAERAVRHSRFEESEKGHQDPLTQMRRKLAPAEQSCAAQLASAHPLLPGAGEAMVLSAHMHRLAAEVEKATKDTGRKSSRHGGGGGGDSQDSSSSCSESSSDRRARRKKKKKHGKERKAKKEKKSGAKDRFATLRAERLMREAGEGLRQSQITRSR